jgi:hypothetical protein
MAEASDSWVSSIDGMDALEKGMVHVLSGMEWVGAEFIMLLRRVCNVKLTKC